MEVLLKLLTDGGYSKSSGVRAGQVRKALRLSFGDYAVYRAGTTSLFFLRSEVRVVQLLGEDNA